MKYFINLPEIEYVFSDVDQIIKMKNIFYKLNLNITSDSVKFYKIKEIKRIDTISFELYGTVEYWWIISLLNNIQDVIFDLPVGDELLQQIAMRTTLEEYTLITDPGAIEFYSSVLDELIIENDSKRKIWIVKPSYISEVVSKLIRAI